MKPLTERQLLRIERKQKKMAALLEITKLNDKDREAEAHESQSTEMANSSEEANPAGDGLCRKRPCTQPMEDTDIEGPTDDKSSAGTGETDSLANKKPR